MLGNQKRDSDGALILTPLTAQTFALSDIDFEISLAKYDHERDYGEVVHTVKHQPREATVVPFNAIDQALSRCWINISYAFKNTNNLPDFMSPGQLERSLSRALDINPTFAGEIVSSNGTEYDYSVPRSAKGFKLSNRGAWLGYTNLNSNFDETVNQATRVGLLSPLIFEKYTQAVSDYRAKKTDVIPPLFGVKLVYFPCGSLMMTAYVNHFLGDGKSLYEFMKLWSQINNGESPDPSIRDMRHIVAQNPYLIECNQPDQEQQKDKYTQSIVPSTRYKICRISILDDKLGELKDKINAELKDSGSPQWVSKSDLFCAVTWRALTRARGTTKPTHFVQPVNIRKYLDPPAADGAIANLSLLCFTDDYSPEDLLSMSLTEVALAIRREVNKTQSTENTKNYIDFITTTPPQSIPEPMGDTSFFKDLMCTNMNSHDYAKINFNNSPAILQLYYIYIEAFLSINPTFRGEFFGSLAVEEAHANNLANDAEAAQLGFFIEPLPFITID